MGSVQNYTDQNLVESACREIGAVIKPGDVVNQVGHSKWWQIWYVAANKAIQWHQKRLFGKSSNWHDTHTMLYFDEDNTFSVELPKATLKPLREYCLSDLSIYRITLTKISEDHLRVMRDAANEMVGENYDIGQLLDIAINRILGFNHQRRLSIFDFGENKKVCSVGVRTVFENLYTEKIKSAQDPPGKWLFHDLNPGKWSEKEIAKYKGTDVEATTPAHFANSEYFNSEFTLIARFRNGKIVSNS